MRKLTRREWIAGTAGTAALSGCSSHSETASAPVGIFRARGYTQDLYDLMRRAIADLCPNVRGKRVVLKPNLVEFGEGAGPVVNTHPGVVHAALEGFRAAGAADVRIAEGPGHRRVTLDLADAAGYFSTIPQFESLFTDLNLDAVTRVRLKQPNSKLTSLYLPNTVLGCDLLVSMPKMKTHHWVGATLGMKNLFGVVPGAVYGWPKNILHWAGIDDSIADLHAIFPRAFTIADGIVGMEGNGPVYGTPRAAGVVVMGADLVAVDATCCRIMGLDPHRIGYLQRAASPARLREEKIPQVSERIAAVQTSFSVLPRFDSLRLAL
jgi:uncharacterized protein (DUF362 family)